MKGKIICFTALLSVLLTITGCQADVRDNDNQIESSEEKLVDKEVIESEEEISLEEQIQMDSEKKEIISAFAAFGWKDDYDFVKQNTFSDLQQNMENLSSDNLFADKFVEMSKSVSYEDYDEVSRLAFDAYLKLLFQEKYYKITEDTLGIFDEAWSGNYSDANTLFLYIRLTDVGGYDFNNIDSWYYEIRFNRNENTMRTTDYNLGSSLLNEENRTIYHGGILSEPVEAFIVEDVKEKLNEMLVANKDFIDFLLEYRNSVYSPARNRLLSEAKDKKDEQDKIDKDLKQKIPQIGMTAGEVKKTKWGSPDKINKDTYSWGTKEQWVYRSKGYVYFENGIVTSVSER